MITMSGPVFHTDEILRKHGLLVKQQFGKDAWKDKFSYVDAHTLDLASDDRIRAYEEESK